SAVVKWSLTTWVTTGTSALLDLSIERYSLVVVPGVAKCDRRLLSPQAQRPRRRSLGLRHCAADPGTCREMSMTWPSTLLNQCGVFCGTTKTSPFETRMALPPSMESPVRLPAFNGFECTSLPPVMTVALPSS